MLCYSTAFFLSHTLTVCCFICSSCAAFSLYYMLNLLIRFPFIFPCNISHSAPITLMNNCNWSAAANATYRRNPGLTYNQLCATFYLRYSMTSKSKLPSCVHVKYERRFKSKRDLFTYLWKSSMQWMWLEASTVKGMPSRLR